MKIVFVGPTVPDARELAGAGFAVHPPAMQGDILRAARAGATIIGLVDGNFEHVAPVWHKEILFALSQGVQVFGAASMGALRAAECAPFGMVGIGEIYRQYTTGELTDDSDVALLHAPAELGYAPLTVPLVNVRATLARLRQGSSITVADAARIEAAAGQIFYKRRTWAAIIAGAELQADGDRAALAARLQQGMVDQKRADALALFDAVRAQPDERRGERPGWAFNSTTMWKILLNQPET
ncbi:MULTISPECIES: TfuA-like protein [unclassified Sinorhizobium]|uniref:TfuA-like protein n=1 Tax=unclassified Sinorhizobium TaxID=2613772 RepID=UPI0024C3FD80|nr:MULTISPECIES: TfuA-like protein [unclassified Sinorhizobium]MDK1377922.1 TfuA-like protein [Sinorhizobium sp. 6-70]MDK1480454.1 TfuA-like protein [Sinorhizobium sp. 6-117]